MLTFLNKAKHKPLHCTAVNGKKCKTNLLALCIRTPLHRDTATSTALLAEVLKNGCRRYPSPFLLSAKTEELYGTILDISILKKGEEQILFFYLEVLNGNESLFTEATELLRQILFEPQLDENGFLLEIIDREKETLKKRISARKDNKREYAKQRCLEEMSPDTDFGIWADGYLEDLDSIDAADLYRHYCRLLKHAPIELLFIGDPADLSALHAYANRLSVSSGTLGLPKIRAVSPSSIPKAEQEKDDILQSRLCMGFFSEIAPNSSTFFSLLVLNEVLGAGPNSLLFQVVREAKGLCYDISSSVIRLTGILLIQAGIAPKDYDAVTTLILHTLSHLKETTISQSRLTQAKNTLTRYYTAMADSQSASLNFLLDQVILEEGPSLSETISCIQKVTARDIQKAANQLSPGTFFFLTGGQEQNA